MTPGGPERVPLFVARPTYRRRRLLDAIRALPVLGLLLWLIPLLWSVPDTPMPASRALIYLFGVWAGLILGAVALIFALRRAEIREDRAGDER